MLGTSSDGSGGAGRRKSWGRTGNQKPAASRPQGPMARDAHSLQTSTFERDLGALLLAKSGAQLIGGAVEFEGLASLGQALVSAWPDLTERIRALAEREVKAHLGDGDIYRVNENASVLLCFLNLDQSEAERRTQQISDHIETIVAREFPGTEGQLKPKKVVATLDTSLSPAEGQNLSDRLLKYLRTVKAEGRAAVSSRLPAFEKTQLYFSPLWSATKSMILLNKSVPLAAPRTPLSRRIQIENYSAAQRAEADYIALSKSVQSISGMLSHGEVSPILVPVHFSTTTGKGSSLVYRKLLDSVSPSHRMLLALEVINIPSGEPIDSLVEAAEWIKPLVKWLVLALPTSDPRIGEVSADLVWAVSTNLQGVRSTDNDVLPSLQKYQAAAASVGLSTIVHGVNSIGLAMAAVKAGITYIDGSAVYPVGTVPRPLGPHSPPLSAISSSRIVKRWKY